MANFPNLYRVTTLAQLSKRMSGPSTTLPTGISLTDPVRPYRFWAVYAAAFARTFSYAIYGVALPNYLIYFQHVPQEVLGLIISANPLAFILGPLLAFPFTRRFGIRNTVLLSCIASVITVGLQIITVEPWALVLLRALDGFFTGFFWPNLQHEVSNWQRADPKANGDHYFHSYAMSWNWGILLGDIVGYIIVFAGAGNEHAALISAWGAMFFMIACGVAMEKPRISLQFIKEKGIAVVTNTHLKNHGFTKESNPTPPNTTPDPVARPKSVLLAFPALFYLLGTLIYAYIKNFYPFVYPLALNGAGQASYWVYLVTFGHQFVQMLVVSRWTTKGIRAGYQAWFWSMVVNIACTACLWVFPDLYLLTFAFVLNGVLSGLLYNFTSKIMLEYGAATGSLRYATLYEFYNGIGFGLSPILAGFIATGNLAWNYPVTSFILVAFTATLFLLGRAARDQFFHGKRQ